LTDAIAALLVDHIPPVVILESAVVVPTQMEVVPVIAATEGKPFTVTVVVTALVQPFAFVYVYVINAEPAETPVISPVIEFTVAMDAFALVQTPPAVALDKVVVDPTHVVFVPVIAVRTGSALTFTVVCEDTVDAHPATEMV
jgi:hypothetical protein